MPPHALHSEQVWDVGAVEAQHSSLVEEKEPIDELSSLIRAKKSVAFLDHVSYREIAPLTELSEEEIKSVWYDDDEYVMIKKVVTATVKKAASGGPIDESKGICMRGLEGRTKFGARKRKNNKARALEAVWSTQVDLWKKKMDNPAAIAAAYKPHSVHACYPAREVGLADQNYVMKHVRNTT